MMNENVIHIVRLRQLLCLSKWNRQRGTEWHKSEQKKNQMKTILDRGRLSYKENLSFDERQRFDIMSWYAKVSNLASNGTIFVSITSRFSSVQQFISRKSQLWLSRFVFTNKQPIHTYTLLVYIRALKAIFTSNVRLAPFLYVKLPLIHEIYRFSRFFHSFRS